MVGFVAVGVPHGGIFRPRCFDPRANRDPPVGDGMAGQWRVFFGMGNRYERFENYRCNG